MKAHSQRGSHHGPSKSNLIDCKSVCGAPQPHPPVYPHRQLFKCSSLSSLDVKMFFFLSLSQSGFLCDAQNFDYLTLVVPTSITSSKILLLVQTGGRESNIKHWHVSMLTNNIQHSYLQNEYLFKPLTLTAETNLRRMMTLCKFSIVKYTQNMIEFIT